MTQYLLSVHTTGRRAAGARGHGTGRSRPSTRSTPRCRPSGAWVFAGGLHPPTTATVVTRTGRRGPHHRRAVRRDQGAARRLLDRRGRRPRRGARAGRQGLGRLPRPGRGASVPGRARGARRADAVRADRAELERVFRASPVASSPPWSASSATSTSPRRRSRRRSSIADRALAGVGPAARTRRRGSPRRPATGRSTGSAARRPATTDTPRPPCCTSATSRRARRVP